MRAYLYCGLLFLLVAPARAEAPPKSVKETWDAAYVEGARCGFYHNSVVERERDGAKIYRSTLEMHLLIKRYQEVVRLRIESSVDETVDGKVVGATLTQFTDKGKFTITALVQGDKLLLKADGDPMGKEVPWNAKAFGPYKQERLLAEQQAKPEDQFHYLSFEPSLFTGVRVDTVVKPWEDVDLLEAKRVGEQLKVERVTKKLLRVETRPDKLMIEGKPVTLPKLVHWVDKDYSVARAESVFPGLGKMTLYRTTKEAAQQEGAAPALLPDLGLNTLIPVARAVDNLHAQTRAVYRIAIPDDDEPATTFAADARQEVKNVKDGGFELQVTAVRAPVAMEKPGEAKAEFLEGSYFIDAADARIKELAAAAVGDEKDAWKKSQRIEKWVHENMKGSSAVGFATAIQVARDLTGDCRQHAMLMTALCRAAGVPARTAVGLLYVKPRNAEPFLGFHMWTEVWIAGQWLSLDATLGNGSVGPDHLKIADHSWHNMQTLAPVLPVLRVMGKAKVEIVSVK